MIRMWPCEGGFVKIFFFQYWIWFFFTKQYFFSYTNYLISGFQKDHVGRIQNEQLFRDQKLCFWRTMACWCDWFSYQLDLHLPQQKEAPKGRRVTRKNEPLSNGPSGRQGWGVGGKPLDTNQGRKGNSRAGVPPTVEKDGVQKYNWWGKALAETNQSKGGGSRNTDVMWGACLIRGNTEIWHHGNPIILHTHN